MCLVGLEKLLESIKQLEDSIAVIDEDPGHIGFDRAVKSIRNERDRMARVGKKAKSKRELFILVEMFINKVKRQKHK